MTNPTFYEAFGKVANAFSWLEGDLRRLLTGMAFDNDFVVASAFLDSSQLRGNLRVLRKFARIHHDYEGKFKNIAKIIENLADRRNLFIHGLWTHATFDEPEGFALVRDLKIKFSEDEKSRTWANGQAEKVSIADFSKMLLEIRDATYAIDSVIKELENDMDMEFSGFSSVTSFRFTLDSPDQN